MLASRIDQGRQYLRASRRSWRVNGVNLLRAVARFDDRTVFVVGSPRSGTSFVAETIGRMPGFADLGELRPLKRVIPELTTRSTALTARRIRRILWLSQRAGLTSGLRAIEQTPESTFLIAAIAQALPNARFLHMVRDGRDVASSLIGLGWLGDGSRSDEVGHAFGSHARFWVEPDRLAQFAQTSEAGRAAWVWRRYECAARTALATPVVAQRALEVRYEDLVADPAGQARRIAQFLDAADVQAALVDAFGSTVGAASGRWHRDLTGGALADVEAEAGELLRQLDYA